HAAARAARRRPAAGRWLGPARRPRAPRSPPGGRGVATVAAAGCDPDPLGDVPPHGDDPRRPQPPRACGAVREPRRRARARGLGADPRARRDTRLRGSGGVSFLRKPLTKRLLLAALSIAIIAATFFYFLPTIANYGQVWGVVKDLSWKQILLLLAATAINLATFAPPWMVALPGLTFMQAFTVPRASTRLWLVVPGCGAAGVAGSYGILRKWGFPLNDVTRAITLTGLWNQFLNLSFPIVAVFMLAIEGESTAALATIAFVGVAILGVVI